MIFDHTIIPFVLAGKTTTTTLPLDRKRLPRKGRIYPLRKRIPTKRNDDGTLIEKAHSKPTAYRLHILDVARQPEGWLITFEIDKNPAQHEPCLLHRDSSHGYTNDPRLALPKEPEAIDGYTLTRYSEANHERHKIRQAQLPLDQRLRDLLDDQARGVSVSRNDLAAIQRRIEAAERKRAA